MNQYGPPEQIPAGLIQMKGMVTMSWRGPLPQPGLAVVYADRAGNAVALPGRPSLFDARRYQRWYQVDITRHLDTITADVPSSMDGIRFQFQADVSWGVVEPTMIVEHGTGSGLDIVRSRLVDRARRITRRYSIDDCPVAEDALQVEYERGPVRLPEGITIFSTVIRLHADDSTAKFHADQIGLVRTQVTDQTEFTNRRQREQHDAELEKERIAALQKIATGEDHLMFVFLSRHPEQVGTVLKALAQRREMTQHAQLALFEKMVSEGFIQEADTEPMRQLLLRPMEQLADSGSRHALGGPKPPTVVKAGSPSDPPRQPDTNGVVDWKTFSADDRG